MLWRASVTLLWGFWRITGDKICFILITWSFCVDCSDTFNTIYLVVKHLKSGSWIICAAWKKQRRICMHLVQPHTLASNARSLKKRLRNLRVILFSLLKFVFRLLLSAARMFLLSIWNLLSFWFLIWPFDMVPLCRSTWCFMGLAWFLYRC